MHRLTIRGIDDELFEYLRGLAQRERVSLNQAILRTLRKGADLPDLGLRSGTVDWTLG